MLIVLTTSAYPQIAQQWATTYNGRGDYNDRFTCIVTDNAGNIYAGGSTNNIATNRDFLVAKSDANGNEIWRKTYNCLGNGPDEVLAITVDATSNVYVTGFGKSEEFGNDFLTIKYDASGNQLWVQQYDYSAHQYDQANSICVDASGNVIVTGQSDSDPSAYTDDDYLTIKYDANGVQQWTARFAGLGAGTDRAAKVLADSNGDIVITGRANNGSNDDYVTIKYNAAGVQQWIQYGDRGGNDRATAMVMDASGNVYVTGRSSNGNNDDFYTIKYTSAGTQGFTKIYDFVDDDRATAIAIDSSGNIIITGQSDANPNGTRNWNYRTVKYNTIGTQVWASSYDGAIGQDDLPYAIAVNAAGAIFVTGVADADPSAEIVNDIVTVKYSSAGVQTWATTYSGSGGFDDEGNAVTIAANGSCVVAGYIEDNQQQRSGLVVKYSTTGAQTWGYIFDGIGDNSDNVRDLKVDNTGNVYVSGYSVGFNSDRDICTIKMNSNGDTLWVKRLNGTSPDSDDDANSIDVDGSGNVIVSGFSKNSGTSNDITLIKYNSVGDTLWTNYYDSPVHETDKSYAMATDGNGNIYLTGRSDSDPSVFSNDNCISLKYNNAGSELWNQTIDGATHGADRGRFIRVAASGNIYISGRTFNGTNNDILLAKYNNTGTQQWAVTYDSGTGDDDANDFEIDANENLYITGFKANNGVADFDYLTMKYNSGGVQQWVKFYNGNGNGDDVAERLVLDATGNVFVTGFSDENATVDTNYNVVTIKYDNAGNAAQWTQIYNGTSNLNDIADGIATDNFGNIYVAAHTDNGTTVNPNYDVLILRYDNNGSLNWSTTYNGASDTSDVPNLIKINGNDIYVAGSSWVNGRQRDMLIIKYSGFLSVNDLTNSTSINIGPNPFTDALYVNSVQSELKNLIFQLYDITGRLITDSNINADGSVMFNSAQMAEGLYTYRISQNNTVIKTGLIEHRQ
ncbi:MAG: SBBP repeat-containing protein [Bacteroidia bacterium]